jgi:hypothetical protein
VTHPLRVFALACLAMVLAVSAILAFRAEQNANHAPGAGCTVVYPDGAQVAGTLSAAGVCQP